MLTILPRSAIDHVPGRGLQGEEGRPQIHVDLGAPVVHRRLEHRARRGDAGVVDEDVEGAVPVDRGGHHRVDLVEVGEVDGVGDRLASGAPRGRGDRLGLVGQPVGDHDAGPFADEAVDDGGAESARPAGDQGGEAVETVHVVHAGSPVCAGVSMERQRRGRSIGPYSSRWTRSRRSARRHPAETIRTMTK